MTLVVVAVVDVEEDDAVEVVEEGVVVVVEVAGAVPVAVPAGDAAEGESAMLTPQWEPSRSPQRRGRATGEWWKRSHQTRPVPEVLHLSTSVPGTRRVKPIENC